MGWPEVGDGIVIGMLVCRQVPECHVFIGCTFDLANSPFHGNSRTVTPAPSSPDGRPPSLVRPYVGRPPGSRTNPVGRLHPRRTAPDDPLEPNPAAREGEGKLDPRRRCGIACSQNQYS